MVNLKSDIDSVDCVMVTTVRNFEEVQEVMEKKGVFHLLAFHDLIKRMEAEL